MPPLSKTNSQSQSERLTAYDGPCREAKTERVASDVDERSRRCRHRRRNTDTTEEKEEREERRNRGTGRRERKRENKEIARYLEKDMRRLVAVVSCFGHEILGASSPRSSYNEVGTTIDDRRWIIIAPIDRFFLSKAIRRRSTVIDSIRLPYELCFDTPRP